MTRRVICQARVFRFAPAIATKQILFLARSRERFQSPGASFASANLEGAQLPSVRYDFANLIENPFIRTGVLAFKLGLRCTKNSA